MIHDNIDSYNIKNDNTDSYANDTWYNLHDNTDNYKIIHDNTDNYAMIHDNTMLCYEWLWLCCTGTKSESCMESLNQWLV